MCFFFFQSEDSSLSSETSNKSKRSMVLKELLETERIYVTELCSVLKVRRSPLTLRAPDISEN